jgi:hypothetical protein
MPTDDLTPITPRPAIMAFARLMEQVMRVKDAAGYPAWDSEKMDQPQRQSIVTRLRASVVPVTRGKWLAQARRHRRNQYGRAVPRICWAFRPCRVSMMQR